MFNLFLKRRVWLYCDFKTSIYRITDQRADSITSFQHIIEIGITHKQVFMFPSMSSSLFQYFTSFDSQFPTKQDNIYKNLAICYGDIVSEGISLKSTLS